MLRDPDKLNIVICDAQESDRLLLKEKLQALFMEQGRSVPVIATFSSAEEMLERMRIRTESYDLIFLGTELPLENGYAYAERIRQIYYDPKIVFLGSSEREAIHALRHQGIYLLTPPFDREEIRMALHIFDENLDKKCLRFHADGKDYRIVQENIRYITGSRNNVTVWVNRKKDIKFTFQKSMTGMMKELAPDFQRVRRNAILNYMHVDRLNERDRCFVMDDGWIFHIPSVNFPEQHMLYKSYMANVEALKEGKK